MSVLAGLGGCAVGPEFQKPTVVMNESWRNGADAQAAKQKVVEARWWESFRDPTLNRLIELASRQNLPLQVAGLRIVEARAQLGVATGMQFPQMQTATGSVTAVGLSKTAPIFAGVDTSFIDYQAGFDAFWELDLWGKYRRGVQAAAANMFASVGDYFASVVSLTAEVARTYAELRTFEVLIELARENVKVQEQGYEIAESRFRNGATSELDVVQATTLLESTRATIPNLETGLQRARNALSTLLGQPTGAVEALLVGPKDIPSAPLNVAVGMPAELLRRRPDIRSAELMAAAQCARIGVAKAELFPAFSLFGTLGLRTTSGAGATGNFGDSVFYAVGPRIVWPFFSYGRLQNGVRIEDARFQQLLVNYQNVVLRAAQEVEDALVGFVNAQRSTQSAQAAVTAAQRSVEISLSAYREGAVDYERVLDAQRSLLAQQNNLADTRSSVVTNLIALYKALGGGWESFENEPIMTQYTQKQMEERTNWGDVLAEPIEVKSQ